MNKIENLLLNSIDNYYTHLSNLGEIDNDKRCTLLVLLFVKQIVVGPMSEFITEADYRILEKVLICLNDKNCLININLFSKEELLNICTSNVKIFKILDSST